MLETPKTRSVYVVDGREFKTKDQLRATVRAICQLATPGEPITDPAKHNFLLSFFSEHPRWLEKWPSNRCCFQVDRNRHGSLGFYIVDDKGEVLGDISISTSLREHQKQITY